MGPLCKVPWGWLDFPLLVPTWGYVPYLWVLSLKPMVGFHQCPFCSATTFNSLHFGVRELQALRTKWPPVAVRQRNDIVSPVRQYGHVKLATCRQRWIKVSKCVFQEAADDVLYYCFAVFEQQYSVQRKGLKYRWWMMWSIGCAQAGPLEASNFIIEKGRF